MYWFRNLSTFVKDTVVLGTKIFFEDTMSYLSAIEEGKFWIKDTTNAKIVFESTFPKKLNIAESCRQFKIITSSSCFLSNKGVSCSIQLRYCKKAIKSTTYELDSLLRRAEYY